MKTASVRMTVLADNTASPPFLAEHGFSVLLRIRETGESGADGSRTRTILFDTGRSVLFGNAECCGADLSAVTDVVLSHGHYDHTDALPDFLARHPDVTVHASAAAAAPHYSTSTGSCRYIGLSSRTRSALDGLDGGHRRLFSGTAEIADGLVHLAENIPRLDPLETPSGFLFSDPSCLVPDTVPEELALWIRTGSGLVVLTGCCHSGFVNTCERVRSLCPGVPIRAVAGGFHLAGVGVERLETVRDYILLNGIDTVVPCHCTGADAIRYLRDELGPVVQSCGCGSEFVF